MDFANAVDKFIRAPLINYATWNVIKGKPLTKVELARNAKAKKEPRRRARERFLRSPEWKAMRLVILERDGKVCACCGSVSQIQIDHILPRSKFPELQLDADNLRVLCWPCNKAKNTKIITNEINGRSPESRRLT